MEEKKFRIESDLLGELQIQKRRIMVYKHSVPSITITYHASACVTILTMSQQ